MEKHLLPQVERYFKTNLHTHSTITDGKLSPQELKDAYKARGYSILAITDHDVVADHSHMTEPDFLMLTGAEFDLEERGKGIHGKAYHLTCIAKEPHTLWQPFQNKIPKEHHLPYLEKAQIDGMLREHSVEAANAVIARANETGHLVTYNHPFWSLHEYPDYAGLKGLWATELTNYKGTTRGFSDRENAMVYRDLVNLENHIYPICADDCHGLPSLGGGWIMVGAEKLDYPSVICALEKGHFYASTGPEIYAVTLEENTLRVRCSDACAVELVFGTRTGMKATPIHNDGLLREAKFNLTPWREKCLDHPRYWFRVVIRGPYGHMATTRAFHCREFWEV